MVLWPNTCAHLLQVLVNKPHDRDCLINKKYRPYPVYDEYYQQAILDNFEL